MGDEDKHSCKGLQKTRNQLSRDIYLDVLKSQNPHEGVNRGFRAVGGRMYTYTQTKRGLSYLYAKRKVLDDGVSTVPLDL